MENKNNELEGYKFYRFGLEALESQNVTTFFGSLGQGKRIGPRTKPFREFKIHGEIGENPDTVNFRKFMKEIEDRINADSEIIERAKKCNINFAESLREILADSENDNFIGSMVAGLRLGCKRYSYIKNLTFDGNEYEAEIDELERSFRLIEV